MDMKINEEHVGEEKPTTSKEPSSRPAAELAGERPKRDEWSEGAVDRLLDVYESKWALRNRAKLKGRDWEEVARLVSSRGASSTKPKTSTQCKNKIESMKKRYRSESSAAATGSGSRWPLFSRLDGLVRCRTVQAQPAADHETKPMAIACAVPATATATATRTSMQSPLCQTNGVAAPEARPPETQEDACVGGNTMQPDEMEETSNHHHDAIWKERRKEKRRRKKKNDYRKETESRVENEALAESIQCLAEVALRMEQARAETMREVEKMRAETEAKKEEMDLKRTEIIANTQLRIATILARSGVELDHLPTTDD